MSIILIPIHIALVIWILAARRHRRGLLGAYGEGVWLESSVYLQRARQSEFNAWGFMALALVVDALIYFGV